MHEYCSASLPTQEEIRLKYNRFAPWYDLAEGLPELLGVKNLRHTLLQRAAGQVLEVAVGTGKNLPYYATMCRLTAVDVSLAMVMRARQRVGKLGLDVHFQVMDAAHLGFPDQHFDTVVDALALCTFPDPVAVLLEMSRVCRPEGHVLLLEHGHSDRAWLGRWQDRHAERHARHLGCHWNREPLELLRQAGLRLITTERRFFGIFHLLEAAPAATTRADGRKGSAARGRGSCGSCGNRV
jgi:ubiquinone/menaquinone biosynthesis C-methylase UbiE